MDTEVRALLHGLGLDPKAVSSYLSLLELGESSAAEIAKHSKLKRPTTYLALEELQLKGLVSETKSGRGKRFSAVHPRRLTEIAKSKLRSIESALPSLLALHNAPKDKPKIRVFEGSQGVRLVYKDLYASLTNKQEVLFFTNIAALYADATSTVSDYIAMLQSLKRPKIRELNYGDETAIEWCKKLDPLLKNNPNHKIRLLPTDHDFGFTDTVIYDDRLCLFSLKSKVFVTVIESVEISTSHRAMFEWAWQMGQDPNDYKLKNKE